MARRAPSATRTRRGSAPAVRAAWSATYERQHYANLPWFDPDPSSQVRDSVANGFWPPGSPLLDIGCGAGSNVLFLARAGFAAHGIDLSPGAVRAARERAAASHLSIDVREGDALALPFPARRFAGATDNGCFHTIPFGRRNDYAREVHRVVRPGGGFVLAWAAREYTGERGPPHRPSLDEVARALESRFQFVRTVFRPSSEAGGLAAYIAWMIRRDRPQPPRR
ncbi:MAG TPA: class I SAM-dependent methyltransferase [Thermoplasmata archaeon]|nr:class I SAM-dependent methyltransferase [Thermoplasmata archaeon]